MSDELCFLSLADASRAIRSGSISPLDLTCAVLNRIEKHDSRLASFILLRAEAALSEARQAGTDIARGNWKGPLHGIPFAVKDIVDTNGVRTTGNSALFADRVPTEDAEAWGRLAKAGAILLGKTGTWEFALGGTAYDLPWPPARNPWNTEMDTGGSSAGSAVALAAGFAFGAIGTDTSGSIRIPAAWCGVAGLKPTQGLVPSKGIMPLSFTCDHAGPMARTSEDCAILLDVMAGQVQKTGDGAEIGYSRGSILASARGLRVGLLPQFLDNYSVDVEVAQSVDRAGQILADIGASLVNVTLKPLKEYDDVCNLIARAESHAIHHQYLSERPDLYGSQSRARLLAGGLVSACDYINALRDRTELIQHMVETMRHVDVLICPVIADPAPIHGGATTYTSYFTRPFSITGFPAHSAPLGFTASGMPLAVQIVARQFEDHLALKVGHLIEQSSKSTLRRPKLT